MVYDKESVGTLAIAIDGVGLLCVELYDHEHAATVRAAFAAGATGRVHRAEPLPPPGSTGPPYALVQMSVDAPSLAQLKPGGERLTRGSLCLVGGASDLFISLARDGEHDGWEGGMTCVGRVLEPELSSLVEAVILPMPVKTSMHPSGVQMTMLAKELPYRLVTYPDPLARERDCHWPDPPGSSPRDIRATRRATMAVVNKLLESYLVDDQVADGPVLVGPVGQVPPHDERNLAVAQFLVGDF